MALLSSASSKTAYGTAFQLHQRPGIEVVGLTSAANKAFCESLGCYHRVLAYEELDQLAADAPCVYVDFAGNGELRRAIHTRFSQPASTAARSAARTSSSWPPSGSGKDLPGPRATLFFAPAQIKKRTDEWGGDEFGTAHGRGLARLHRAGDRARGALAARRSTTTGAEAVQAAYAQVLAGPRRSAHRPHPVAGRNSRRRIATMAA